MRIAVVSDIYGNLTASYATEIVDRIRDLGWLGIAANTDEMLYRPQSIDEFVLQSPHLTSLFAVIAEMADATRERLGESRLAWLRALPTTHCHAPLALVHAGPRSLWRAPSEVASDAELDSTYAPLGQPVVVYGHIHRGYVRALPTLTIANSGSVGLPYDGDCRASYLLLDNSTPSLRRVEYNVEREIHLLRTCGIPHAAWTVKMLKFAVPQLP